MRRKADAFAPITGTDLFVKMFAPVGKTIEDDEVIDMVNQLCDKFEQFETRVGPYSKAYIWKSKDLVVGRYVWHCVSIVM